MSEGGAAGEQLNRIVSLVAELNQVAAAGGPAPTIGELALRFGTSADQVRRDVATLTAASDESGADWLSSIGIQQEGDRLSITSQGPFRRPVRLTPMEVLALQVGLAAEGKGGAALLKALNVLVGDGEPPVRSLPAAHGEEQVLELARGAATRHTLLRIKYAGAADHFGRDRTVEPHGIVAGDGHWYVVAWCRAAADWRYFRADRVLDAEELDEPFKARPGVPHPDGTVFRSDEPADAVDVRFSPEVARFVREERPDCRTEPDGGVVVTYHVTDPQWLVRRVLSYGADAEIVRPAEYRHAVRRFLPAAR